MSSNLAVTRLCLKSCKSFVSKTFCNISLLQLMPLELAGSRNGFLYVFKSSSTLRYENFYINFLYIYLL
jgi:hypothetical protein